MLSSLPRNVLGCCLLLVFAASAVAFNGNRASQGVLTLTIEKIAPLTELNKPHPVTVTLANSGASELPVTVELRGLVDEFRASGPSQREVRVPAKGQAEVAFPIVAGPGIHTALYPVHVRAQFRSENQDQTVEAVEIFATEIKSAAAVPVGSEVTEIHRGATPLATIKAHRVFWSYLDGPETEMPVGWLGTEATSRGSCSWTKTTRGESKTALSIHPPYRPKAGTLQVEYRLKLPTIRPLRLDFSNAIRDNGPKEPASDGVTFRVWVDGEKVFDRHSDSKVWLPGEADLSRWAGKQVRLRLESHPGPRRSTTCDSSFWGDPIVIAGEAPQTLSAEQKAQRRAPLQTALRTGRSTADEILVFELAGGCRAAVALGECGLADGWLGFADGDRMAVIDGLQVAVLDHPLGVWPSALACERTRISTAAGRLTIVHDLRLADQTFPLTTEIWADRAGLRVKVACAQRITDLAPGAVDQLASRVYYGHGYCIVDPQPFRASPGGHGLSTSHVGFDFQGGLSLLVACDAPPDGLVVDSARRIYSLHTHPDATFTFVPSATSALACAVKYRPLYDKQAAPGVARKAGRFVMDIWGGKYAADAELLQQAFAYGLTDALVIMHNWQRWGYDYRLPDIFPPNPAYGTLAELRALGDLCKKHGVLWGLHDNYIDFYPDAEGYSYEHICFTPTGQPHKAWINTGRDAQSYRWRPDRIRPFVERNLRLIKEALAPDTYFLDVFSSMNSFDFYDRQGEFHSKLETRRAWGETFDFIRDCLGNAPTSSEAGGDHLIGHLDGADCQFMLLSSEPRRYRTVLRCQDWDRVPWFDAVNHTRFSLHGVGYSNRYQAGYSRALHGIESDDYLSAEMLTGHALMIDLNGMGREAVRKYWLAQDLIRSLAQDEIVQCELAEGDIHRTITRWKSGACVYVNRGDRDWSVAGHVLPRYGYWAENGAVQSSIERIGGAIVEQSRSKGQFYVNGRAYMKDQPLRVQPRVKSVEYLGERKFKCFVEWDVREPIAKDLNLFVQFYQRQTSRLVLVGFQGVSGKIKPPTSQWQGQVTTGDQWTITVPEDCPAGEYEITVGLLDTAVKPAKRLRMWGDEDGDRRYRLGTLVVEGNKQNMTGVRLQPAPEPVLDSERLVPNAKPTDFGVAQSGGALRCQIEGRRLTITPLPDSPQFALSLQLEKILGRAAKVGSVRAIDAQGAAGRQVEFRQAGSQVTFDTAPDEFAYRIELQD